MTEIMESTTARDTITKDKLGMESSETKQTGQDGHSQEAMLPSDGLGEEVCPNLGLTVPSCALCGVTFTSLIYLDDHQRRCRGKKTALEVVDVKKITSNVQSLAKVTNGRKVYCCEVCVYETVRSGHMTRHLLSHMGARPYTCEDCNKSFTQPEGLRTHRLTHISSKPYSCSICDFTCKRPTALKRHMTTHTGEVMYACPHCDYRTAQKYNLKMHTMIHNNDKPYKCAQCEYRAVWRSSVEKHERSVHSTEPQYFCQLCPRAFKLHQALSSHLRRKHKITDQSTIKLTDSFNTNTLTS